MLNLSRDMDDKDWVIGNNLSFVQEYDRHINSEEYKFFKEWRKELKGKN